MALLWWFYLFVAIAIPTGCCKVNCRVVSVGEKDKVTAYELNTNALTMV